VVAVNAHIIACGYAFGAALLALWLFLRCPRFGPQTLRGASLTVAGSYVLLLITGAATGAAEAAAGTVVALLGVYLPLLMFPFWAALRLLHVALATTNRYKA
jgi:hypothetical protein